MVVLDGLIKGVAPVVVFQLGKSEEEEVKKGERGEEDRKDRPKQ